MDWKKNLQKQFPIENIENLSIDDDYQLNQLTTLLAAMTEMSVGLTGPKGFNVFYTMLHHLLFYAMCCLKENKFPALNTCWDNLSPLFIHSSYQNKWLALCWMFCDFPLSVTSNNVLVDDFEAYLVNHVSLSGDFKSHLVHFTAIMRDSRLGLYQEILSTSKITKFRELFTGRVISTVRSVPEYEPGEIFLARIVSYLGDKFTIHDSVAYPKEIKDSIEDMVRNKLPLIAASNNEAMDYQQFMKLAGPYWMSCTHESQSLPILSPNAYQDYYTNAKTKQQ